MNDSAPHQFADDSPKSNPWTDDTLGFAKFSKRMAEAIVHQSAPAGYVVGLHGEWGSGKSTVLNFVRSYLKKWREESLPQTTNLQWFDFEPWIVSGHQDLSSAFLKVLSEKLGDSADTKARLRRGAKSMLDIGSGPLIDTVSKLGYIIDHTGGLASKAGAAVTKAAMKKGAERWLAEPSLQKTYEQLVERLRTSNQRFIVFVDDIDRLIASEIRALMQMVKTIGKLPNVTYCLSYDRQIVWEALRELAPGDRARSGYAEKIIQHELEVPVPSRNGLMRMLEANMPDIPPNPGGIRWIEIKQYGLNRWLRHPRDVLKLSNAMNFSWAALQDEVDAHDVLCMEALRLFDRKVFDWIRDHRDLLLGETVPLPMFEKEAEDKAEALARTLRSGERADVIPLMRVLFANKSKAFGTGRGLSSEEWSSVVNRRGIATSAGFTAYFSLAPSPSAVPKRFIDEAATEGTTRQRQAELIDHATRLMDEGGASLVGQYLEEVSYRISAMMSADLTSLLLALIDRTEQVYAVNSSMRNYGPMSTHHTLVGAIIDRLGPEPAADVLEKAFQEEGRLGPLAGLYVDLARGLGVMPDSLSTPLNRISSKRLADLGKTLLPKIRAAADAGALTELQNYYDVAHAWHNLAGSEEPKAWLAKEARGSGRSLAKLSQGLLSSSTDEHGTHYSYPRNLDINLYDIDAIANGCDMFLNSPELTADERNRISVLKDNVPRFRRHSEALKKQYGDNLDTG